MLKNLISDRNGKDHVMDNMSKRLFKYYQKEGKITHHQKKAYRTAAGRLLMQVHKRFLGGVLTNQAFALDVGCAEGWHTAWMAKYANFVLGIDISMEKLRRAVNESKNAKTEYVLADWDHLPLKDKIFDVVLFSEGPEHSLDPRETIIEIRRVLKKAGFLSVSAPVEPESFYYSFIKSRFIGKENPFSEPFKGHLRSFTPLSLKKLVLSIGFKPKKAIFDMPTVDFPFRKTVEKLFGKRRFPYGVILARKLS